MLHTLRDLSERDALMLLSATAQSLLPNPGVGGHVSALLASVQKEKQLQVIEELRRRLNVKPTIQSAAVHTQLLEALSSEIGSYVLSRADVDTIKTRLASRDALRNDQYEVTVSSSSLNVVLGRIGIRRSHLEEVIHQPHVIQRLTRESDSDSTLSVYLKHHTTEGADAFTLLVVTSLTGHTQAVQFAVRVYHSDVMVSPRSDALEVLTTFVDKDGLLITISAHGPKRLWINEVIQAERGITTQRALLKSIRIENRRMRKISGYCVLRVQPSSLIGVLKVLLALAIDSERYEHDLRRHGIKIPESRRPE